MKLVRAILFSVFALLVSQLTWGQAMESLAGIGTDPVRSAKIYPNPAVEFVSVKFEEPIAREVSLELHSIIGNSLEVESEIVDDHEVRVKVKDLPAGYYLLDVRRSGAQHSAFKFLKR